MATIKVEDLLQRAVGRHVSIDPERVRRYRRILDKLPPVVVFQTPEGLLLADGYHRLEAAIQKGRDTIEADVRVGSRHDALEYAVQTAAEQRGQDPAEIRAYLTGKYGELRQRARDRAEAALEGLLERVEPDETVLAESYVYTHRADPGDDAIRHMVTGPGVPIVVSDQRAIWYGDRGIWDVAFDSVTSYRELTFTHRYALVLEHQAVERTVRVQANHFLWWSWGNAHEQQMVERSMLGFSHRGTRAAEAIRQQLEARGVAAQPGVVVQRVEFVPRRLELSWNGPWPRIERPRSRALRQHRREARR